MESIKSTIWRANGLGGSCGSPWVGFRWVKKSSAILRRPAKNVASAFEAARTSLCAALLRPRQRGYTTPCQVGAVSMWVRYTPRLAVCACPNWSPTVPAGPLGRVSCWAILGTLSATGSAAGSPPWVMLGTPLQNCRQGSAPPASGAIQGTPAGYPRACTTGCIAGSRAGRTGGTGAPEAGV